MESVPWPLVRTQGNRGTNSLLLLGMEALFKPLSPDRATRQNHLLTGYYPAAVQDTHQREATV